MSQIQAPEKIVVRDDSWCGEHFLPIHASICLTMLLWFAEPDAPRVLGGIANGVFLFGFMLTSILFFRYGE